MGDRLYWSLLALGVGLMAFGALYGLWRAVTAIPTTRRWVTVMGRLRIVLKPLQLVNAGASIETLQHELAEARGSLHQASDYAAKLFQSKRREYNWFRGHVESATEVWAFWHSGASAKNNGLFRTGRIKKLLLAFPNGEGIQSLADVTHIEAAVLRQDIFEAAKEAQKWGVEVKWWQGHIVPPFTIGDPTKSGTTWVITEQLVPYLDADQRPGNYITEPQVCDKYREAFMEMWSNHKLTAATIGLNN